MIADPEAYRWRIGFHIDDQLLWKWQGHGHKINPNKPPAEYGKPVKIQLVPTSKYTKELPMLDMQIPDGASPVYHALKLWCMSGRSRVMTDLIYRIGWRRGNQRGMQCINMKTLETYYETDTIKAKRNG